MLQSFLKKKVVKKSVNWNDLTESQKSVWRHTANQVTAKVAKRHQVENF